MKKAEGVGESLKSKEKQDVFNFNGFIGTVGAIGGSGHRITLSSTPTAAVDRDNKQHPGISYNLAELESCHPVITKYCCKIINVYLLGHPIDFITDYETGLRRLWGDTTLSTIRKFTKQGKIQDFNLRAMAIKMGVLTVYNQHIFKLGVLETFERMLETWYEEKIFQLEQNEAQEALVSVMEASRCSSLVIAGIKKCLQ